MNTLKSILVHADASPQTATRLQAATALARAHGASVKALYAVLPIYMQYPYSLSISAEAAALLEEAERDRSVRARTLFDKAVSAVAVPIGWSAGTGDPVPAFTRAAACSDLVVIGQHDPTATLAALTKAAYLDHPGRCVVAPERF